MPILKRHFFWAYFLRKLSEDFRRDNEIREQVSRRAGVEKLSKSHFSSVPRETAFVLGTGCSVNQYPAEYWDKIRRGFSIGVNFWLLHDFVPDAYSLEIDDRDDEHLNTERDVQLALFDLRKEDYSKVLLMTRGRGSLNYLLTHSIPDSFGDRLKLAISLPIHGDSLEDKVKHVDCYGRLLTLNRSVPKFPGLITPGISATILFLTLLCYELGFKKVVLCGVDLNNSTHFYEQPLEQSRMIIEGWPTPPTQMTQKGSIVHPTFDRKRAGGFNVKDYLCLLQERVFSNHGFQVYSGSPSSALVPELPSYPWGDWVV